MWLTGPPSAGKSTLAARIRERLEHSGRPSCVLDSDDVRSALRPVPGYRSQERDDFYATLANLAALVARQGLVVLVAATAHREAYREQARSLAPRFLEVHVTASRADREGRDAKGLYARVRAGELAGVPGADLPYEEPRHPDVVANGCQDDAALERIVALIGQ